MNWHLLVELGFLLTLCCGLTVGSTYQYYKEQKREEEREKATRKSSFMGDGVPNNFMQDQK